MVYETLSTYLKDHNGKKVQLSNAVGELAPKLKTQYQAILAEDAVISLLSNHLLSIFIVEAKNDT